MKALRIHTVSQRCLQRLLSITSAVLLSFLQKANRVGSVAVLTTVLSKQAGQMTDGNASLQGRVAEAENIRVAVQEQVQDFQQKLQLTISDNVVLRRQLDFLQKQVGVSIPS